MPELPEIETVKLQLAKVLVGNKIEKIEILNTKTFVGKKELVEGKKVLAVQRRAKVLLIDLEGAMDLAFHFKMSGQLVYIPHPNPSPNLGEGNLYGEVRKRVVGGHPTGDFIGQLPSSHTRVIFHLDKGKLYFNDQRKFGWVRAGSKAEIMGMKFLTEMGPEPFDMDEETFRVRVSKSKKAIKLVLMDQAVISGVGNIYANDALWEARIYPGVISCQLSAEQMTKLFSAVKLVLEEGIKYGGATAADAKYINLQGLGGHYQDHFRTYDREGEPCLRKDGGIIEKIALGGRGTYFCPVCQR